MASTGLQVRGREGGGVATHLGNKPILLLQMMLLVLFAPTIDSEAPPPSPPPPPHVPALDDMAGDWMNTSELGLAPAINNFHGGLWAGEAWAPNANGNVLAISGLAIPPFFMPHNRNLAMGNLTIDGNPVATRLSRWFPYQVLRRATVGDVRVETTVRMVFEGNGVLFRTQLELDGTAAPQHVDIAIELNSSNVPGKSPAQYWNGTGRGWKLPPVPCTQRFTTSLRRQGTLLTVKTFDPICKCITKWNNASADLCRCHCSNESSTRAAFAFATPPDQLQVLGAQSNVQEGRATWNLAMQPGEIKTIDFVMAVGDVDAELMAKASDWAATFNIVFAQAKDLWQGRFNDAFTPGNGHFSGNLPTLVTADAAVSRSYYMGIVTLLGVERTNYPLAKRWYMTNGVDYQAQFFWDLWNLPTTMALVDPEIMRGNAERWLALDYTSIFAEDYKGRGVGEPYQANMAALFETVNTYVRVTGDSNLLDAHVSNRTVLRHLEDLATYWKRLAGPRDGQVLVNSSVALSSAGFSLTCWVKNAGQGTPGTLLEAPSAGENLLQIYLTIQNNIGTHAGRIPEQTNSISTLTVQRNDEQWHFVAVVSDGVNNITYTVDGASETAKVPAGFVLPTHLDKLLIGNNCKDQSCLATHSSDFDDDLSNHALRATVQDWRLYDLPLSPTQVASIRAGSKGPHTALAAAFNFSEGEGTVATDWSGHNRTATLSSVGAGLRWVGDPDDAGARSALEFNTFIPKKGYSIIADYGTRSETWPSYIYRVPSYNMPNAWMMRTLADIYEARNQAGKGKINASVVAELRADSDQLAKAIVDEMYVPGEGCWQSIYPGGRTVLAKNVQDLVYIAYIMGDIPLQARSEIMEFIERELLMSHWMRGLSPWDPDANKSVAFRCDFSRWGCYDGSVAYTIDAIFKLGFPSRSLDFLRRTASVTYEGPYGNARVAWGPRRNESSSPIRKCEEAGGFNQQAGAGFAEVIIRTIFGFHGGDHGHAASASECDADDSVLYEPKLARDLDGMLLHVRHRGKLFTITSNSSTGLTMVEESKH